VNWRQKKKSWNFANKSLTEKFYENLVHFVRWAIREWNVSAFFKKTPCSDKNISQQTRHCRHRVCHLRLRPPRP
jgi:hypothetical protein